jgi:UMF1 family MFS transporter
MVAPAVHVNDFSQDEKEYKRRIQAWTMYDWANSAFATTILAAVFPIYYSQVAGANLPSAAVATSYWSLTLSIALIIAAIISPILGTVSDIMRGKKRFLSFFVAIGVLGTAGLFFIGTGDWFIASVIMIVARLGFTAANTFYDALLPHIAKPEEQDAVSTRGYAMGYLGGGILLAVNAVMIFQMGFAEGARWSFLSVAIWWFIFSIPIFRRVPEPPAADGGLAPGESIVRMSFARIRETMRDVRRYRELFKFLIAFLIYNDAIGTIIGVAAIYGAELGFGDIELILALLLVQFVGIPFSLIFGWLPSKNNPRRPFFLAFILFNIVALPLVGVLGSRILPQDVTGILLPPYETQGEYVGTGVYGLEHLSFNADWQEAVIPAAELGTNEDGVYMTSAADTAQLDFAFHGQEAILTHSVGPDHGTWSVLVDGAPLLDADSDPVVVDAYNAVSRYGIRQTFIVDAPGEHILSLVNTAATNAEATGNLIGVAQAEVLTPISQSSLPMILGAVIAVQLVGLVFAQFIGRHLVRGVAETLDTKRSIMVSLLTYSVIAVWGYFISSTIEFWFLAWMVAIVQGGSQALSRSLYAAMSPASKSGEFFGLFGVMEKFSAFIGPLIFAFAVVIFGSSRPAILALIAFFIIGGYLLARVDVEEGRRVAQEEDATLLGRNQA